MKAKLGAALVAVACGLATLTVGASPAEAATYTAKVSQAHPIIGERVVIRGVVKPSGRPVALQVYKSGHWATLKTKTTGTYGRWAFAVHASSVKHAYRSVARAAWVRGHYYTRRTSNVVRILGVKGTLGFDVVSAPVGQTYGGTANQWPGTAQFSPARPGTQVVIQRRTSATTWQTFISTGKQNSFGAYTFNLGTKPSLPMRAIAYPGNGAPSTISPVVTPTAMTRSFQDTFTDPAVSQQHWTTRVQEPGGLRKCAKPAPGAVSYADGNVLLKTVRKPATTACKYGFFLNGMIGTAGATTPFTQKYGIFAARIKLESGQGQHGSFWLQGPAVTGDEIDAIEYYGDGRADGGLSNLIHHTSSTGATTSAGGIQPRAKAVLAGRKASAGYHVFSVQWSSAGYVFRMDGVPTFKTASPHVSAVNQGLILSLLTSDWELSRWRTGSTAMSVDWVRAWSAGS